MSQPLTVDDLIAAYSTGFFPMAEGRDSDELYWFNPTKRGIIPLDGFNIPASLKKFLRQHPFELRINTAFHDVMRACAEVPRNHEKGTWINDLMLGRYTELHRMGLAHSVETWQGAELVGGLYGVSIGGAFFGESMFSRQSGASKVALVALVSRLRAAGYTLLDTQFINDHLLQFGAIEIPKARYLRLLAKALAAEGNPTARFAEVAA